MDSYKYTENLMGGKRLGHLNFDERLMLDYILNKIKKWGWRMDSAGLGYRSVVDSCEKGYGTLGFLKDREFLNQISDYRLLKSVAIQT